MGDDVRGVEIPNRIYGWELLLRGTIFYSRYKQFLIIVAFFYFAGIVTILSFFGINGKEIINMFKEGELFSINQNNTGILYFIFISLFCLGMMVGIFIRGRLISTKTKVVFRKLHHIFHFNRDSLNLTRLLFSLYKENKLPHLSEETFQRQMNRAFRNRLIDTCDWIKDIVDIIYDDDCAVCIKIIDQENRDDEGCQIVFSTIRDRASFHRRSQIVRSSNRDFNSACKEILDDEDGNIPFISKINIKRRHRNYKGYPGFLSYYNNILAIPIRFQWEKAAKDNDMEILASFTDRDKNFIIGFLTIDSKKRPLNDEVIIDLSSLVADYLYHIISSRFHIESQISYNGDVAMPSSESTQKSTINLIKGIFGRNSHYR